jgi:hypothetical protein
MGRIEELAEQFSRHIAAPWPRNLAGAQRVIMITYDKELERVLRARKPLFEMATRAAGHDWHEIDLTDAFAAWMAKDEYRDEYFNAPEALQIKLQASPMRPRCDGKLGCGDFWRRFPIRLHQTLRCAPTG